MKKGHGGDKMDKVELHMQSNRSGEHLFNIVKP